jgi:ribosomal protein S18 acetylase RimI-like enzyme
VIVHIIEADLADESHGRAIVELLDAYAREEIGQGAPLSDEVRAALPARLRGHPTTRVFLALKDGQAVGVAVCFVGFSTFRAKPLINIHDLAVAPSHRGRGVGGALLDHVAEAARAAGYCAVTLEVRRDNDARRLYERAGFQWGDDRPTAQRFMVKRL